MGHRNPFRIQVDQETGWLYNGEVGPDANADNANRGPRGYDELNQIRAGRQHGLAVLHRRQQRPRSTYRDWTYPNGPAGDAFDCSGGAAADRSTPPPTTPA